MFSFSEIDEIRYLLGRAIELEPEHERELSAYRDGITVRPSLADDVRAYLESAIMMRGWEWEPLGAGVCIFLEDSQSIAVPGPESPRSITHALLSAYVGALEAVED